METFKPSYFMLVPTMACQAACKYCFAQKYGDVMNLSTLNAAMDFMERIAPPEGRLQIVFHGGEPLLAGATFYEYALPALKRRFGARLHLSMQSNLWALNGPEGDRLTELLLLYRVSVGTSLDGFREMCDAQRGEGYCEKTTAAMEKLRGLGISAGIICTFGKENVHQARRVFEEAEESYSIHGAVPCIGDTPCTEKDSLAVSAEQMKRVLLDSYEAYRDDPARARVSTIDAMAGACFKGESSLCTFKHCLGEFAAIAPDGKVYSCQRFNGLDGFSLGNVNEGVTEADILRSPAYRRLKEKQDGMAAACGGCAHYGYCKGGCLYSAFAGNAEKDPYCEAYRAVFDRLKIDMALEMAEELKRKLGAPAGSPRQPAALPLLAMVGDKPHPYDRRVNRECFSRAVERGKRPGDSLAVLRNMNPENFTAYCMNRLKSLYLNLTYRCPLRCTHCSANAGSVEMRELDAAQFAGIVGDAVALGFQRIEFSGGEPFVYPEFDAFLEKLSKIQRKGTKFIFRTSFGYAIPRERIEAVCRVFDSVIVSIDGDEEFHDRRRGKGVYQKAVENLRAALAVKDGRCAFELCAVLSPEQRRGKEGIAFRKLGADLGIGKLSYKALLPLGRGCGALPDTARDGKIDLPRNFQPFYSCGIGESINVEPNGDVYPCYAWCEKNKRIGNLGTEALEPMLLRGDLFAYRLHGVDTNEQCADCDVRYLCGGMCKAWVGDKQNFDAGGFSCHKYDFYKKRASLTDTENG